MANPVDGAVLLFKGDAPEVAEKFAKDDPYVTSGAVKWWYIREWTTVVGEHATTPIRPKGDAPRDEGRKSSSENAAQAKGMILRMWKGRSTTDKADKYIDHVIKRVLPALGAIEGHRGAYLLRRAMNGATEFVVLTLWDSMAAVRRFAGAEAEKAVVEPEARAVLTSFDETVSHFEVVRGTEST